MSNKTEPAKLLVFDIETSDFKANFGHMLMWAAKWIGSDEIISDRIDDTPGYGTTPRSMIDDFSIVKSLRDLVDTADVVIYHYGDRFDLRFLNTRCLLNQLLPPAKVTSVDTWKVAKYNLAMTSNRLLTLSESLGDGIVKSHLEKDDWKLAVHGDRDVLNRMHKYCVQDVLSTEAIYLKMRPLIWNHPVVHPDVTGCPLCGSKRVHGNGTRRTKLYLCHRQRCASCGHGFVGKREYMGRK